MVSFRGPVPLGSGAHVVLLSPSGPLAGKEQLEQAQRSAAQMGWSTTVGQHALERYAYFAGDDHARAADLRGALLDRTVDGIWCLRGGYGASRILPLVSDAIELMAQRQHPQALIGYSDITALHAAWQRAGLISYHGPTARSALSAFSQSHFVRMLQDDSDEPIVLRSEGATCLRAGVATGRLAGGNLALVSSLIGTPWEISFQNAIAVLEDIDEASYRIDRMLTQLLLSGAFRGCVGLALGHFTNCVDTSADHSRPVTVVMQELADALQVPAVIGLPIGHIDDQWTLPLGASATLDSASGTLSVNRRHHYT